MSHDGEFYVLFHRNRHVTHPGIELARKSGNTQNGHVILPYSQASNDCMNWSNKEVGPHKSSLHSTNSYTVHMNSNNNVRGPNSLTSQTGHNSSVKETQWSTEFVANLDSKQSPYVPSLDLSSLTGEDHKDNNTTKKHLNKHNYYSNKQSLTEEALFTKKQRPAFVFPSEKSLSDYDRGRSKHPHVVYEDPTSSSPHLYCKQGKSQASIPSNGNPMLSKGRENPEENKNGEQILHFSLANPKLRKYILDGTDPVAGSMITQNDTGISDSEPIRRREGECQKTREGHGGATHANESKRRNSVTSDHAQEVIDVVVVNGHLHNEALDDDYQERRPEDTSTDSDIHLEEVVSAKEKPKPRVTFSFHDDIHSSTSLKRYTPVKTDVRPLHGVLKKRQEPVHVISDPTDSHYKDLKHDYFKDAGVVFRTDKKADRFERGIPVKHIHPTISDLAFSEKRTKTAATNVSEKPPIPLNNRISLSAAERSAISGSNKGLSFTAGLSYVPCGRGGAAYFRPAEGMRSAGDLKTRPKSAEDVNAGDGRHQHNQGKRTGGRPNLPFTLRRCASSEYTFISSTKGRPIKPKVAFGSFILPKETTPRMKTAQVNFQDIDTPHVTLGSYVHPQTRRSPYAAPAQVLYRDDVRQNAGGSTRRPYTAQTKPHDRQKAIQNNQLMQRHSAPSSYSLAGDRGWRASRQRLTIDNSPTRTHVGQSASTALKLGASTGGHFTSGDILPNKTKVPPSSATNQKGKSDQNRSNPRPDIATLNMIANKAKGVSQYRFLATLQDKAHGHNVLT